jgi:predicted metalloprotease
MVKFNDQQRESQDVEDRRGQGDSYAGMDSGGGGGGIQIPGIGGGGIGIFGLLIMLGLWFFFGVDPRSFMGGGSGAFPMPTQDQNGQSLPNWNVPNLPGTQTASVPAPVPINRTDELTHYVKQVHQSTTDFWTSVFQSAGKPYPHPTLVFYDNATPTGCGTGQAAMGPFYCPEDQKVYLDLAFYKELASKFGAPGNFAQAYVVAHEVGHHIQKLLGIADQVQSTKERVSQVEGNALQVRMELQADCFAGVWFNNAAKTKALAIEPGDIEGGMTAANSIGDDTLQRKMMGRIVPDAFTHGTSAQRQKWLKRGLDSGNMQDCDTFNTNDL